MTGGGLSCIAGGELDGGLDYLAGGGLIYMAGGSLG